METNLKSPATAVPAKDDATKSPVASQNNEDLDAPYIDKRNIIISLSHNYSTYRKVNFKTLGQRTGVIGSCITSSKILSSNSEEVAKYFPQIVGVSANNPEFTLRVKSWLNNIQFIVNENDVPIDISFRYDHKRDYLACKDEEERIYKEFEKVDRSNIKELTEGVKTFVNQLNALEGSKYKYGMPLDVEAFLIYRHCLLYNDVAKDTALINSDPYIRFYIKNPDKEAERESKITKSRVDAMAKFVKLNDSEEKFNSVYINIIVYLNENLTTALTKSKSEKQAVMMKFVNDNPDKFNKICTDGSVTTKAFIYKLIAVGELVKSDYNQQISTAEGDVIGANMNDAIAYFNSPEHKDIREAYVRKLNAYNN